MAVADSFKHNGFNLGHPPFPMITGPGKTESYLTAKRGFLPLATFRADGLGLAILGVTTPSIFRTTSSS